MKNKIIKILVIFFLGVFTGNAQKDNTAQLIEKLKNRPYPQWFKDAKFGIFIHWGLYSVPAYGGKEDYSEWFLRGLQTGDSLRTSFMKKNYGEDFTYNDFTRYFKAELFNPNDWAELFKKAGAKYVVLVSKHHDGYALWPSKYNRNWNSVDTGPKRDIVGELIKAVRKEGLKMGLYYSLPEWNNPLHRWYTDPNDSIAEYVEDYMIPQFKELVSTYKPSLIFTDGEWYNTAKQWHAAQLINWYYNEVGKDAIVNDRWGNGIDTGFLTPEYSSGIEQTDRPWAEVRGIGRSFGLNRNEKLEAYDTSKELIQRLVQTVANGGGMILNVGPKADGQIPLLQQERLVDIGKWLEINGAAIYGSTPYKIHEVEKKVDLKRIDSVIDFNWVRNSPMKGIKEDHFSIEWNGFIVAPKTATYTFEAEADDAVAIVVDGKMIINKDYTEKGTQSEAMAGKKGTSAKAKLQLEKGKAYPITVNYKEEKQNASVHLLWSSKNRKKKTVPASSFFQDRAKNKNGLKGTYSSMQTYLCYTQSQGKIYAISFEWPDDELVLDLPNPGKNAKVRMLGIDRKLNWKYENGKMHIDTSDIGYEELPSNAAWSFEITKNGIKS